jgi:hypothetical protein
MASMMGGDFVVANVLKNAYKEKVRRLEEEAEARNRNGAAGSGSAPAAGENKEARAAAGEAGCSA